MNRRSVQECVVEFGAALGEVDLESLETEVERALDQRDHSSLKIIGFGEISIALGYPAGAPTVVCKRAAPATAEQAAEYQHLVERYIAELTDLGIKVVPTSVRSVVRGDQHVVYLVQHLLPSESIGHNVLAAADPTPDHPLLTAIGHSLGAASERVSFDAQVTNWSFDGEHVTLLDIGTPFMWDRDNNALLDPDPLARMLPAVIRPYVVKDVLRVMRRWQTPNGVATDLIANLYREGLPQWVEPATVALNRFLRANEQVDPSDGLQFYEEDRKTFPRIKRLQRIERAWSEKVRRRPYGYFVHETTFR